MRNPELMRWERWILGTFPPPHVARRRRIGAPVSDDEVWHVEFQDGKLGRIHVEPAAVQVDEEEFRRLVAALERSDWYAHLDRLLRIRIRRDGSIVPVR